VWLNTSAGATDSTSPIKYRCPKCGSHRRSLYPPRGAEEERAGVNEMHTHRAIFEVNFAGAGPRWRSRRKEIAAPTSSPAFGTGVSHLRQAQANQEVRR
jgi:hypothetical protein